MKKYFSICSLFILLISGIVISGYQSDGNMSCSAPEIIVNKPLSGEKIESNAVDVDIEMKSNGVSSIDKSSLVIELTDSNGNKKDIKNELSESCDLLNMDCRYGGVINLVEGSYKDYIYKAITNAGDEAL